MPAVSDTSPISNLAMIGRLKLLREQFGEVWIPRAVAEELRKAGMRLVLTARREQRLKALEMRGNALRQIGRTEEALAAYQDGLRTGGHADRSYLGLHYEIATCLEEQGKLEEALQHFERAFAIDGEFLDVADRVRSLLETG